MVGATAHVDHDTVDVRDADVGDSIALADSEPAAGARKVKTRARGNPVGGGGGHRTGVLAPRENDAGGGG